MAEAVGSGSQPRPGDQRSHPDGSAEVYALPGTGVMTFSHAWNRRGHRLSGLHAPPAPRGRRHTGPERQDEVPISLWS